MGEIRGKLMDRRQRKTRQAIYEAFEGLMAESHYSQITVAQIIERADVGRSTFYAHFETKDDLLEQMCVEMFDHVFEGVSSSCTTHASLEATGLEGLLAHLLYHLRDNHGAICGKLLREGEPHFTAFFRQHLAQLFERRPAELDPSIPHELAEELLVSSFCQAIAWWLENDQPCSPDELAHWFMLFVGHAGQSGQSGDRPQSDHRASGANINER